MRAWRKPTLSPSASIKGLTRNYAEKTLFLPLIPMQRSLLLLALAALFVGCNTTNTPVSSAAPADARFSWEKDAPAPAPDLTRATVRKVSSSLSLLEIGTAEKRDAGAPLQLSKYGRNFLVEVIKADETSTIVAIKAGREEAPEINSGDDLALLAQ
jgi:hypothetical protein